MKRRDEIVIRALQTTQGDGLDVFSFFIRGADIVEIADISRIDRDQNEALQGFQRPEIQTHVKGIADYLNQGCVLFPNAIILAFSPEVKFVASRGTKPSGDEGIAQAGTLTIPVYDPGKRVAWIVDGQQRSLALSKSKNCDIPVPVVAFVSDRIDVQREQFILVNKARPLPSRLINELLPETRGVLLPRELNARKVPSELCNLLNRDSTSPFYQLIKRPSDGRAPQKGVVTDTAVINMIKNSMDNPLGALAMFRQAGIGKDAFDLERMYRLLMNYWTAVKNVFPQAWGLDSRQSRLMHSAGIICMGVLMDRIFGRGTPENDVKAITHELRKIEPFCRWTEGVWETIGSRWNEIENTPKDLKRLQSALIQAYTSQNTIL